MEDFDKHQIIKSDIFVKGKKVVLNLYSMKKKERYFSPEIEVIKVQPQGVVCQSVDVTSTITNPFEGNTELDWGV